MQPKLNQNKPVRLLRTRQRDCILSVLRYFSRWLAKNCCTAIRVLMSQLCRVPLLRNCPDPTFSIKAGSSSRVTPSLKGAPPLRRFCYANNEQKMLRDTFPRSIEALTASTTIDSTGMRTELPIQRPPGDDGPGRSTQEES
jgi:hypothetical protein